MEEDKYEKPLFETIWDKHSSYMEDDDLNGMDYLTFDNAEKMFKEYLEQKVEEANSYQDDSGTRWVEKSELLK